MLTPQPELRNDLMMTYARRAKKGAESLQPTPQRQDHQAKREHALLAGELRFGFHDTARWLGALALLAVASGASAQTGPKGDVFDQFFRYTEDQHKVMFEEMPKESVDPFTGTLHIVQEDLALPGRAGLDLHIIRTYRSKIVTPRRGPS